MELQAIYKTGELHLQTTVTDGICDYTNGKTVEEYLSELGKDFVCIPLEDAIEQINAAQEKTFIKPWKEITEDQWMYCLEVLPPVKWETVNGVNLFQLSELMIDNIALHCARYDGRFFSAYRRTSNSYEVLAKEIKQHGNKRKRK